MLEIKIPIVEEQWNESTGEFINEVLKTIRLEHSLVSIHKWESKWHKPFLTDEEKTIEETIDYIKCMTITQNVSDEVYNHITVANIEAVNKYISDPMTATRINDPTKNSSREQITAELIYYWMVAFNIPTEYRKWHLNSLLTLIRICEIKSRGKNNTLSNAQVSRSYAEINAARRKAMKSKG